MNSLYIRVNVVIEDRATGQRVDIDEEREHAAPDDLRCAADEASAAALRALRT